MLFDSSLFVARLRVAGLTACGIVLALMPVSLWVAWSGTVFLVLLASGLSAGVLLVVFLEPEDDTDPESTRVF